MKLKKLTKDIPNITVKGPKEIEISGLTANSKLVVPGNLFIAKKGASVDGNAYIPEAIKAGAIAVLTDVYDPSLKQVAQLVHSDVASIEGFVADVYYQSPSKNLLMVGVTGTNGKTTTSYAIKHLLDGLYGQAGLIGTVEYLIGNHCYQASRTTPDVCTNHKFLREMLLSDCSSAVMEVTSHALVQGRVDHIDYDIAVFTNLTQDHLDYHKTMEEYGKAKNKLFRSLDSNKRKSQIGRKVAVVNKDDIWADLILEGCQASILGYGIESNADLKASEVKFDAKGTTFIAHYNGKSKKMFWPLVGRFNVYNALGAIGVLLAMDKSLDDIAMHLQEFKSAPGRLESVPNPLGLNIFVDYAHSDDALKKVLLSLQELKKGRIITIFGCGGDRDKHKRPKMAQAVEENSDIAILTSDNPRSEDPMQICQDAMQGFKHKERHIVEIDRYKAIQCAVNMANPLDIILIAGKGHETSQTFAHRIIDFDDRLVAKECCEQLYLQKKL